VVFAQIRDDSAFEGYGVLRRLAAKYAARGLDITVLARTQGYLGGDVIAPDSEAVRIRQYFLDELKLPVTLGITLSDFGRRSDGRLTLRSAVNEVAYQPESFVPLPTFLVDAHGIVRLSTRLARENEALLDDMIAELLTQP
jgi:hypothetical protein